MEKTIAHQLNVKEYPFVINGSQENKIYFENPTGDIIDNRPKPCEGKTVEIKTQMRYTQDDYLNLPDEVLLEAYSKVYAGRIHKHSKLFPEAASFLRSRIAKLDETNVDWWDWFIRELDIAIFFSRNPNYKFPNDATKLSDDVMAAAYDVLYPDRKDTLKATKIDYVRVVVCCYENLSGVGYKDTILDFIDYVEKQATIVRLGIAEKLAPVRANEVESVNSVSSHTSAQKATKSIYREHFIPIYNVKLFVAFVYDEDSYREICDWLGLDRPQTGDGFDFTAYCLSEPRIIHIFINLSHEHKEYEALATISHECFHAMNRVCEMSGIKPDILNQEPQAYLLDFISECAFKTYLEAKVK